MDYLLSRYHYDINYPDCFQETPLFWAASNNSKACADLLIKYGANVNHVDKNQQTPIFYAAGGGYLDMCKMLVNRGASFQHLDANKETPIHYARKCAKSTKNRAVLDYFMGLKSASQRSSKQTEQNSKIVHFFFELRRVATKMTKFQGRKNNC